MMERTVFLLCLALSACATFRPIAPDSREFHDLRQGDILVVKTQGGKSYKVKYLGQQEDSLFASSRSFALDSIARIEKEGVSGPKTGLLIGGIYAGAFVATVALFAIVASFYSKLVPLF